MTTLRNVKAVSLLALCFFFVLFHCSAAKADGTLNYTLTAQGSTTPLATWQMSADPTPTCPTTSPPSPCFVSDEYFLETVELSLDGGPATPDTLGFFNSTFTDVDLNDLNFSIPEFLGPQLYSGDESAPEMSTGTFTLTDDGTNGVFGAMYNLEVTAIPEPDTLLLLGSGVLALGLGVRRNRPA